MGSYYYQNDFNDLHHASIESIKSNYLLSAVVGERVDLKKVGKRYKGCCPFHDDRNPSLSVDDETGTYLCFGCGAKGDVISFVQHMDNLSFREARNLLQGGNLGRHQRRHAKSTKRNADAARYARTVWNEAMPIDGTPAAEYLYSRGIPTEFSSDQENLRFSRLSFDGSAQKHPALVAAVRDVDGEVTGIQRIYLTEEGEKLAPDCKRSLGTIAGGAVRINPRRFVSDSYDHVYVCEGLEDGLSVAMIEGDAPVWVALGASNLGAIKLPDALVRVTVASDNDDAGEAAAAHAERVFVEKGLEVYRLAPPSGSKDWNAYLLHWENAGSDYNDLPWIPDQYVDWDKVEEEQVRLEQEAAAWRSDDDEY